MPYYPSSTSRCRECGGTFETLEDEVDMHDCPVCGASPRRAQHGKGQNEHG